MYHVRAWSNVQPVGWRKFGPYQDRGVAARTAVKLQAQRVTGPTGQQTGKHAYDKVGIVRG